MDLKQHKINERGVSLRFLSTVRQIDDFVSGLVFSEWTDPEVTLATLPYYKAIYGEAFSPAWIIGYINDVPVLIFPVFLGAGELSFFGRPFAPIIKDEIDHKNICSIIEFVIDRYIDFAEDSKSVLKILDVAAPNNHLKKWQSKLLSKGGTAELIFRGIVDLSDNDVAIKRSLRKSYKSLINWGKKNINVSVMNAINVDEKLFHEFRLFHKQVAGRVTRPLESWNEMLSSIEAGDAILISGFFEGRLVASTYFHYNKDIAIYNSGVYDRELFDKPIAHWPLFSGILALKEIGVSAVNLGIVFVENELPEKDKNIAFFKKGFCTNVKIMTVWKTLNS